MAHIPRIHWPEALECGQTLKLDDDRAHHLLRVLKRRINDPLTLFQADGEWRARVVNTSKSSLEIEILEFCERNSESTLRSCLVQAISRGDKMDFTIQKAVELGVTQIQPVISQRGGVQLDAKRLEKKQRHWQAIALSASEQSGRLQVPKVAAVMSLRDWLGQSGGHTGIVMHPDGQSLNRLTPPGDQLFNILVGPEGGLDEMEIEAARHAGLSAVRMGPRILRTETAGLVGLSAAQLQFGDLN